MQTFLIILAVLVVAVLVHKIVVRRTTIFEFQKGLLYRNGKFVEVVGAGEHWFTPLTTRIDAVDIRRRTVTVPGQEVLTADGVTLKVSLVAQYEVVDPAVAVNTIQDYEQAFYLELQVALRHIVGGTTADVLLEQRQDLGRRLMETAGKIALLGLQLHAVDVMDVMFPGELKKIFAQVVKAQKEGLAAVERARGETAALRNLANAARLVERQPSLMQLRLLHSIGESTGNTVVLGFPPSIVPVAREGQNGQASGDEPTA
jgi:regulator of protease activity HflC (stomatin/prohibitin superfamily)